MAEFFPDIIENNVGNRENAGNSIFSFVHIIYIRFHLLTPYQLKNIVVYNFVKSKGCMVKG